MTAETSGTHPDSLVCLAKSPALTRAFALSTLVTPPLGLAYLAGTLRQRGIAVQIVDAIGENPDQLVPLEFCEGYSIGLSMDEVVSMIDERADIIGLSCMFSNSWPFDRRLIEKIRRRFPKAWIVVGGEHATACANYILETSPDVDVCVLGEGEETIVDLVRTLREGRDLSDVAGIAYRDAGNVCVTPARNRIRDIDDIPQPAWDLVPLENYMSRGLGHGVRNARNMPLMATRGCPYQCTFCSSPQMWTTRWIARNPVLVVDEIETYVREYNAENFDLYDLTAIIRKDWIMEFTRELLRRGIDITYQLPSGTRSEAIDEEVAKMLYRSGCRQMNYAPESGSPETLLRIKKKVKLERLEQSLRGVVKRDLKVMLNIIFFPDDTFRDVWKTFGFALRCSWLGAHDITFVPFVPYPGTELFEKLQAAGRIPGLSEEYFISLLTHSDLANIRSYNPNFSARQVLLIRLAFLLLFYSSNYLFHPTRFFSNAWHIFRNAPTTRGERVLGDLFRRLFRIYTMGDTAKSSSARQP